eukprot:1638285-Alexandrium_andersonii.AAC.1
MAESRPSSEIMAPSILKVLTRGINKGGGRSPGPSRLSTDSEAGTAEDKPSHRASPPTDSETGTAGPETVVPGASVGGRGTDSGMLRSSSLDVVRKQSAS